MLSLHLFFDRPLLLLPAQHVLQQVAQQNGYAQQFKNNFTGYDDLRVLGYVAMVATPKQWIPSINVSTAVHYAV